MLKIHTSDGQTARVDLDDGEQAQAWLERLSDPDFQARITGFTLAHRGVQYSLPRPLGFDQIFYSAEHIEPEPARKIKGGERISCIAGDVRATIMVHRAQRAARITLFRTGKQRFNPVAK